MESTTMTHVAVAFATMSPMDIGAIIIILFCLVLTGIFKINPKPRPNKRL